MIKFKFLTILFISLYCLNAKAALNDYKYCNHHKFQFAFLKIYDVYLCSNDKAALKTDVIYQNNFSLIINYNRNFSKEGLAKRSIKEIKRYYQISEEEAKLYYEELLEIFPDVKPKDIIEAKYNKKGIVEFYYNQQLTGKITDKDFSIIFLNIWLHPNNHYNNMIKDLFNV